MPTWDKLSMLRDKLLMIQAHSLFASLSPRPHHLFPLAKRTETKSAYWLLLGYSIGTTMGGIIFHGCPSVALGMELKALCVARGASSPGSGLITMPQTAVRDLVSKRWMCSEEWISKASGLHMYVHTSSLSDRNVYPPAHTWPQKHTCVHTQIK